MSRAVAQLLQRLQPVAGVGGAVGRPDLEAVPAALGGVHRGVGAGEQQRAVAAVVGAERRCRCWRRRAAACRRGRRRRGGRRRGGRRPRCARVVSASGSRTANSSPPIRASRSPWLQGALEARADQAEQVVADAVPEAVVDLLEPVQVDHQDGARPAAVAVDGGLQLLDEAAAVGQAGQRVVVRLGGQLREAQLLDRPQRRRSRRRARPRASPGARPRGPTGTSCRDSPTEPVTISPRSRSPESSGTLT